MSKPTESRFVMAAKVRWRREPTADDNELRRQGGIAKTLRGFQSLGLLKFAAIPNGGKRSKKSASILKNQGVSPGFPDLVVTFPKTLTHLYLETKTPAGRLSRGQIEWHEWLKDCGHKCSVVQSVDDVLEELSFFLHTLNRIGLI
ncbi:MAG: VRR-NUC domain-containing protein [Caulobacteraceae bacterium]|nr:VRR-NUC domain-containing protein [Caulobacteraceae bacterium]